MILHWDDSRFAIEPGLGRVVERLGGPEALESSARETKAFQRARAVKCAVDMLRLVLAYCLGEGGLRSVAIWAAAIGLVDISNVGLLYRLRQSGDWLSLLISRMLADATPKPAQGRLIRLVDATVVPKAGCAAKRKNAVWRVHSAFELPSERFGFFELTDEKGGERLDRMPVIKSLPRSLPPGLTPYGLLDRLGLLPTSPRGSCSCLRLQDGRFSSVGLHLPDKARSRTHDGRVKPSHDGRPGLGITLRRLMPSPGLAGSRRFQ